jgi:Fe-S-cluster-containing hydrogenase component 2
VQLVRLSKADFDELVTTFPGIRKRLTDRGVQLLRNEGVRVTQDPATGAVTRIERRRPPKPVPSQRTPALQEYVDQQLYQGQHMLVLDLDKCTRCDECVTACAQSHLGITRLIRDGLRYENYLVTTSCRSCRDPKCLVGCPVDAIHRKGSLPIIIEDHCVGCGRCAENCPFGNVTMHPIQTVDPDGAVREARQAAVCNLDNCIEEKREPSCVYACPHDAAHRVDGPAFFGVDVLGPREGELPV